jgi:hypothetical protein
VITRDRPSPGCASGFRSRVRRGGCDSEAPRGAPQLLHYLDSLELYLPSGRGAAGCSPGSPRGRKAPRAGRNPIALFPFQPSAERRHVSTATSPESAMD